MKYSLPGYSPYGNPDEPNKKTEHTSKSEGQSFLSAKGIPNYSTSSGVSGGQLHKPYVNSFYSDIMGAAFQPKQDTTSSQLPDSNKPSTVPTPQTPASGSPLPSTPPPLTRPNTPGSPASPRITIPFSPSYQAKPGLSTPKTATPQIPSQPGTTSPTTPTPPSRPGTILPNIPATPGTIPPTTNGPVTPGMPVRPGTPNGNRNMPVSPNTFPVNGVSGKKLVVPKTQPQRPALGGNSRKDYNFTFPSSASNSIYMTDASPYHVPYAVPMMPLYGYDNCEDADKDWDYIKQMFPIAAKKVLVEVEDECDKLEYDGSCMFDEYPDRVYLSRIVDKIYVKCKYLEEDPAVQPLSTCGENHDDDDNYLKANNYDCNCRDYRQNCCQRNWLKDFIEVILFNEMLNRRRRYRGRNRWF